MLAILLGFCQDGTIEFHGEHFDFGPTSMYPEPEGPLRIWVGGKSDAALQRQCATTAGSA